MVFILVMAAVLFSCGGGGDSGGGGGGSAGEDRIDVHTNPTDGTFLTLTSKDGTAFTYHGARDEDGYPVALRAVTASSPDIEGDFVITLDDDGMPETVYTPGGGIFRFEHTSTASFRLTAVSNNGSINISVPVEIQDAQSRTASNDALENDRDDLETISDENSMPFEPQADATLTSHQVRLIQCEEPRNDANIVMHMNPSLGTKGYLGKSIGDGYYEFNIPLSDVPAPAYEIMCDDMADQIKRSCGQWSREDINLLLTWPDNPCSDFAKTIKDNFSWAQDVEKKSITEPCEYIFHLVPQFCEWSQQGDLAALLKSAYQNYLQSQGETGYTLTFEVKIPGTDAYTTTPVSFDPDVFSSWSLEAPAITTVGKIWTEPSDPMWNEWYTAKAEIVCPDSSGTEAEIHFKGSDHTTGSYQETFTANGVIEIDIPGATDPQPVVDQIWVTLDGQPIASQMVVTRTPEGLPDFPAYYKGTLTMAGVSETFLMRFIALEGGSVHLSYKKEDATFWQNVYGTHDNGAFTIVWNSSLTVEGAFSKTSVSGMGGSVTFSGTRVDEVW
ncbi:MAG: hypothetical protein PVJ19_03650 [Desulfobacteraceae bacterium]